MARDANDAARPRWIVPLSPHDQSPTLFKKVTSLLLFTAEKFAAVDDKLTKNHFFPWARGFLEELRKPGFRRF
jgi:hypothetical protein